MKKILTVFVLFCISATALFAQDVTLPFSGDNQKCKVKQYIGPLVHVSVMYSSPDVTAPNGDDRTGKIWGQLVPYGMTDLGFGNGNPGPWRAGANENTVIHFSHDVTVQGRPIAAGTYGLHMIVEEDSPWTIIFSNNSTAWGSFFYDEEEDALRVTAIPEKSEYHEWLTYEFTDRQPESAVLALKWENLQVPIRIEVPNQNELIVDNLRKELQGSPGFDWQNWRQAASYCLQEDYNLEEALTWADNAISMPFIGQKNFNTLKTKAQVLEKLDRQAEATAVIKEAIEHPTASPFDIHAYGRQLIASGEKKAALDVFIMNAKKFDNAWPTNVGLARGYAANGDFKSALKYAKMAHEQAPDQLNKDSMANAIEKLKNKEDIN